MQRFFQRKDKVLLAWFVIGIVLRLILMPIGGHNDSLDSHWRSHAIAVGEQPYPGRYQYLSHALDAAWLRIIAPVLPGGIDFFDAPEDLEDVMMATTADFDAFCRRSGVRLALFLIKIPYLIADLAAAFLLLKLFDQDKVKRWALGLWMVNPPLLYAVYIFGRYETYALLCILGSLVLARRGRVFWAATLLGFSIACRATPILLLPVYALGLTKDRVQQFVILGLGLLPNVLIVLLMEGVLGLNPEPSGALTLVAQTGPIGMLTNTLFNFYPIMPYFFGFALLLLWLDHSPASWRCVVQGSLAAYLLIYVTTWHSAHYIAWLAPFLVILIAWKPQHLKYYVLFLVAWVVYWMFATDAGVFTRFLFSPLFGRVLLPPQTQDSLMPHLDFLRLNLEQMTALVRSLLAAVAGWLVFLAFRHVQFETLQPPQSEPTE